MTKLIGPDELLKAYEGRNNFLGAVLVEAPTIDAEPVRHGKWLLEQEITDGLVKWNRWSCSCCGYVRTKGWATTSEGHKPTAIICENCGARMVEDE